MAVLSKPDLELELTAVHDLILDRIYALLNIPSKHRNPEFKILLSDRQDFDTISDATGLQFTESGLLRRIY